MPKRMLLFMVACCLLGAVFVVWVAKTSKPIEKEGFQGSKTKEVVGSVVGGPQIVSGSPLVGYAVFVKELGGMVALNAQQCPPLGNGQRVVMYQNDRLSEWYTFIRYE